MGKHKTFFFTEDGSKESRKDFRGRGVFSYLIVLQASIVRGRG